MKQLTCELCDGTEFVKQDGFFICQGCGTKYSLEDAKKLMMDDGTPTPEAPKANNSAVVENYVKMAENAIESSNNAEAESYANKVLELDPANSKAWEIKGKAAGWQSKTNNNRIPEAVNAFMMAVEYATPEEKADVRVRVGNAFRSLAKAMLSLHCENFGNIPDDDHAETAIKCLDNIIPMMNDLVAKSAVGFNRGSFYNDIARLFNNSACDGFKEAKSDFGPEHRNMAKWQWERFTGRCDACLTLLDKAIELVREAALAKQICDNYKTIGESARDSCSWKFNVNSWNADNYDREYSFTDSAKNARTKAINDFMKNKDRFNVDQSADVVKKLSGAREASEIEAGREQYWAEHADEKARLNARLEEIATETTELKKQLQELNAQRSALTAQLNAPVPATEEKNRIKQQIDQLNAEMSTLGIFKGKQKKALKEQIDQLYATMHDVDERIKQQTLEQNAPINNQIDGVDAKIRPLSTKRDALEKESASIKNELTKSRGKISTTGLFHLKGSMTDGKFTVTYTDLIAHLKTIIPSNYVLADPVVDENKLSSHVGSCRKSIVTDSTIASDNKNTGTVIYMELEPGTDNVRSILLQGPHNSDAKNMYSWCLVGACILMTLSPETQRDNAEAIFADLAFSDESTWYGEHGISVEYADYIQLSFGKICLRNSCAVIRPD